MIVGPWEMQEPAVSDTGRIQVPYISYRLLTCTCELVLNGPLGPLEERRLDYALIRLPWLHPEASMAHWGPLAAVPVRSFLYAALKFPVIKMFLKSLGTLFQS
jgi:hypothetical protein